MKHVTSIDESPEGWLAICETCGERHAEHTGYGAAQAWCDEHEQSPHKGQPHTPLSLRTLERLYRDRSEMKVFTVAERREWLMLANELAERIKVKREQIEGQMSLFLEEDYAAPVRHAHND